LGFGGRVLDSSMPKYLNSPDSPIFHKGHVFYGLDRAAKHIRTQDTAILVEGYTDWLALEKAGFLNVVATLGTAFTPHHAKLLTRYCTNVVVLFDGDEAGRMAARRSLSILLEAGLYPKGITLPYELDPDEFLEQHGPQALKHALEKAQDLYDLIVEEEVRGHSGEPSEKVQILDRLGPLLESVQDMRLRELYMKNTADFLNVDIKLVKASLDFDKDKRAKPQPKPQSEQQTQGVGAANAVAEIIEIKNPPRVELDLLNLSLMKEAYLKEILASGIVPKLSHQGLQQVFELIEQAYGQSICKFDNLTNLLVSRVKPAETVAQQLTEPLCSLTEETARKFIHDCIRRIEENSRKAQARALMSDLRGAQGETRTEKMEQFMNVQRSRRHFNQEN
jgi:DNA primase